MTLKRLFISVLALLSCAILVGCGSSSGSSETTQDPGNPGANSPRIYMLAAKSGQLSAAEPGAPEQPPRTLTLKGLELQALWYADRPGRDVGSSPIKDYLSTIWKSAYGNVNPNATIQFQLAGADGLEGLFVTLSDPSYDEKSNTVVFRAKLLNNTLGDDSANNLLDFNNAVINVLNNAVDDTEVTSYVQYASQASLEPTSSPNQYKVVLSNAGPDMFWVDNAPGKYSDARPMSYFFPQWPYTFGANPPNAALFGTTASGESKLYFVTLTDPVYDEPSNQVTYTATLLGQTFGALETLHKVVLSIDSSSDSRFPIPGKGTGYQAFGGDYNPSTANTTYIYFGSDIARKQMGSLWGTQSNLSQPCGANCRNDLQTIKDMGINLLRLYDWDPRNDHSQFLNHANALNLKVVVPISNWLPTQSASTWDVQVPGYFSPRNFGNSSGTDWHPAIAGVIISNELDMEHGGQFYPNAIGLVERFIREADTRGFSKNVPVGVPVSFVPRGDPKGPQGQNMPGWNQFNQLLTDPRTAKYKDRLMLCPQTYNEREYLFVNAEGSGKGWVQLTYEKFGAPILFTEIGYSRSKGANAPTVVREQLLGVVEYQKSHPEQLLGATHFQFDDKVWKQTDNDSDSEGAFGTYHHGEVTQRIETVQADYDFSINEASTYGVLSIDKLTPTSLYDAVVGAYKQ